MLVLLGLLCFQTPFGVQEAELLTGGAYRPGLWAPLQIDFHSSKESQGELVIQTDFGFSLVQSVTLSKGRNRFLVPVLALSLDAPLSIQFRQGGKSVSHYRRARLGRGLYQSDLLIRAEGSSPNPKVVLFSWVPKMPQLHWYEAVNAVVGAAPVGYEDLGGIVADSLEEAILQSHQGKDPAARWLEPIDQAVYELVPSHGWVLAQRDFLIWFLALYLFLSIVVLGGVAFWKPRVLWVAILLLPVTGFVVAWTSFPGGSVVVVRQGCDLESARTDLYFTRGEGEITFPGLVKPLFDSYQGAKTERFEIRVDGAVTRIKRKGSAWRVYSRMWGEPENPPWRCARKGDGISIDGAIVDGELLWEGKTVLVGDQEGLSHHTITGGSESHDPIYRYFRRKIIRDGNFLYGRVSRAVKIGGDIEAVDLAEVRDAPRVIVQRMEE